MSARGFDRLARPGLAYRERRTAVGTVHRGSRHGELAIDGRLDRDLGLLALAMVAALATLTALGFISLAHSGPAVTVYTHDLGFVRERRSFEVGSRLDTVRLADISKQLDFSSVRLDPGADARVRRLAYRFDVASGDQLIENAVGQWVHVALRDNRDAEGVLVAEDGAWLVIRSDEGSVLTLARSSVDEVRLAHPPAQLSLRSTLEAVVESSKRGKIEALLSYLTGGLSWSAEHTVVRRGERELEWSANVTVENNTGRDYVDADLKLVAGEPHRDVTRPMPFPRMQAQEMTVGKIGGAEDDRGGRGMLWVTGHLQSSTMKHYTIRNRKAVDGIRTRDLRFTNRVILISANSSLTSRRDPDRVAFYLLRRTSQRKIPFVVGDI
jgi:hypothetical protein